MENNDDESEGWGALVLYLVGGAIMLLWSISEIESGKARTRQVVYEYDEPLVFWAAVGFKLCVALGALFKVILIFSKKIK